MPKLNVYLPHELAMAVRESAIPVSAVCQRALAQAVEALDVHAVPSPDGTSAPDGAPHPARRPCHRGSP